MEAPRQAKLELRGVSLEHVNERTRQILPVLQDVDLKVYEGELVCLVGPSGCGKTTLLNAVDGLMPIVGGKILVDNRAIDGPGPDRAMVFQADSLFPWRTVVQNVMYGLELQRQLPQQQIRERALALIQLVGLGGFADHYPHELSGGMRQRVNIARALVMEPKLLLLDEPFAALDAQTREFMQVELLKIFARTRTTALFVTHQIGEAVFLSTRVVVLSARPAQIKEIIDVDLPPMRTLAMKHQPEFLKLEQRIWRLIEEEAAEDRHADGGLRRMDAVTTKTRTQSAGEPRLAPPKSFWARNEHALLGTIAMTVFLLFWEAAVVFEWVNPLFTSSPSRIATTGYGMFADGSIWPHLRVSGYEFIVGFGMAIVAGIPLGILMGWYGRLNAILDPFVSALYATPRIALLPLIMIWFGIGIEFKIAIVFLGAVFPILVNTITGVRTISADFVKVARSFGASDRQLFMTVALPSSVPLLLSGLRLGLGHALIGIVVGEMYGASYGIGHLISVSGARFQTDAVMVGIIIIARPASP